MRRGTAHLTIVLGDPATVDQLRSALAGYGVAHAAVMTHPWSIRRSLVLGENAFVVLCIALDESTIRQHGPALRSLLSDHECFPTEVRTVGLLSDLGLTREAAELGCDVYVEDSAQAAAAIRLLDEAWSNDGRQRHVDHAHHARPRLRVRGGWMVGSPDLPAEERSLVSADSNSFSPAPLDRTGEDFGDLPGPP